MGKRRVKKPLRALHSQRRRARYDHTADQIFAQPYLRPRPVLPRLSDFVAVVLLVGPIAYVLGRLPLTVLALASSLQVLINTAPLPGRLAQPGRAIGSGLVTALAVGIVMQKSPQVPLGIIGGIVATIPLQFVWLQLLPQQFLTWKTGVFHTGYQSFVVAYQVAATAMAIAHVQRGTLPLMAVLRFFLLAMILSMLAKAGFRRLVGPDFAEIFSDVLRCSLFFGLLLPSPGSIGPPLSDPYLKTVLGVYIGNAVANIVVFSVARRVRDKLDEFRGATPYLAALARPLVGFLVAYGVLILSFAVFYWFLVAVHCDLNPRCTWGFRGLSTPPTFLDFLVYSSMTITTLTSDVAPTAPLTKLASSAEAAFGMLWVAAGFAAVLAYLHPRFSEIARQSKEMNTP